jgi:hypothetical protein
MEKGLVEVIAVSLKGLDQLRKQLLALLVPQPQDIPEGVHDGVDATQPVEVPLPVSALALRHQLLFGAGLCGGRGGDDPTLIGG